jgi:hypothetical protein
VIYSDTEIEKGIVIMNDKISDELVDLIRSTRKIKPRELCDLAVNRGLVEVSVKDCIASLIERNKIQFDRDWSLFINPRWES